MFVRSAVFFEAGGFDEEFSAHMEEIDLCWRMKNLGHKIMYCGSSTVYHVGGGTLQKSNPYKTYLNFRNNLMMLIKNTEGFKLFRVLFVRVVLDDVAQLKFLLSGNFKDFLAVLHAQFYVFSHFFKIRKKRKGIKENVSGVYNHSIVADYFLRGKKKFSDLDF